MSPDKLVRMANQIGRFFQHLPEDEAAAAIRDHLEKFWEPRMRVAIRRYVDDGGGGLEPFVAMAIARLDTPKSLIATKVR